MSDWRVGFHTYTWQALQHLGQWSGSFEAILDAIAEAGFAGVEATPAVLGDLIDQPARLRALGAARHLRLVGIACSPPTGWTNPADEVDELRFADRIIHGLAEASPGGLLVMGGGRLAAQGAPLWSAVEVAAAWRQMLRMYHQVAARAMAHGLRPVVHPTSEGPTIIKTEADYDRLAAELDPNLVGLAPDTAHLVRGGVDVAAWIERHINRIRHIHLKDARRRGNYVMFGEGDAEIAEVTRLLRRHDYNGWLIVEEESEPALADVPAALRHCRSAAGCLDY